MGVLLASGGAQVTLLTHKAERADELKHARENTRLLKGVKLPENIQPVGAVVDFEAFDWCFCAVPTRFVRAMFAPLASRYPKHLPLISLTKGIEQESLLLPSALLQQLLGAKHVLALSGPSHAEEVARGLPASVVVAGDAQHAEAAQKLVSGKTFRAYVTDDLLGVEIAGAAKNVVAIAAGILEGLKFGDNAKAALVARGLAEITRLGVALGAKERTFYGLSGVGDLYTTCASPHGRNRAFGLRVGKGEKPSTIIASQEMEVEGFNTAKALKALAAKAGVEMPIVDQACRVLYDGVNPRDAVIELMTRHLKAE
jgi:glycerol-3-phosphate dehydrogenase (NAD(P)+)